MGSLHNIMLRLFYIYGISAIPNSLEPVIGIPQRHGEAPGGIPQLPGGLGVGEQAGESNSIQNQKKYLEEYARQKGLRNIRHFYDDGYSGTNFVEVR